MKKLPIKKTEKLLTSLKERFLAHTERHLAIKWEKVERKLRKNPQKVWSLYEMERTGGEPDVVDFDRKRNEYIFYDCSAETPKERRSLCYDKEALKARKEHKPAGSAVTQAESMGIQMLTEEEYRKLQELGAFDVKTSSWIQTPPPIRKLGGALFCDRRYDHVFTYHNGAESYYAVRGFRGSLRV